MKPCETGDCPFNNSCDSYTDCLNEQLNTPKHSAPPDA
jgi:hypothetical protein